jgi:hypothetical protein
MSRITRVSLGSSRGRASGAKRRGASEAEARPTLGRRWKEEIWNRTRLNMISAKMISMV